MSIPLILHQIWWQGETNIPDKFIEYRKSWFKNHLKWKFILWDKVKFENLLRKLKNQNYNMIYADLPYMIQKIDFCKYIVLKHFGGAYVDMDTISEKPLDQLFKLGQNNIILSKLEIYKFINYKLINNGVILSKPFHNFYDYLIYEIYLNKEKRLYQNKDWYIISSTGPLCFSFAVMKYIESNNTDIIILEPNYLESCNMTDIGDCNNKGKFITHIHNSSWLSPIFKLHFYIIKFIYINRVLVRSISLVCFFIILYITLK